MSQSESSPAIAESTAEGASPAIPSLAAVTSESESVTVSDSAASPPSEPDPTAVDTNSEPTPDAEDPFADPTSPMTLEPIVSPSEGELDGEIDEDIADEDGDEAANEDGDGDEDEDEADEERDPDADDDDEDEDEELEEALFWHDQILSELHRVCRDGDPSVTGSYKILDTLGTDRMGNTTYTARAARTGEIVAVRITHLPAPPVPRLAGQRLIAELFLVRDMRSHPNVLSFLDLYVAQDRAVWLVTEHLQGAMTLEALIALNHAAFTEERMARICLETCKGLAHLHEQLILHRDIRSASIIVSPTGRVKITAFTFAAQLPSAADKRRTMVSTLALPTTHSHYTPDKTHWTPPEVIRRQPYGPEVDVWALGITLIECIDGAPPYHAADPLKVLFLILVNGSPKPARDEGGVSEGLGRFLEGCLEVDVEKRKSVAELLEEGWLEGACEPAGLGALFEWGEEEEEEGAGGDAEAAGGGESAAAGDLAADSAPTEGAGAGEPGDKTMTLGSAAPRGAGHVRTLAKPDEGAPVPVGIALPSADSEAVPEPVDPAAPSPASVSTGDAASTSTPELPPAALAPAPAPEPVEFAAPASVSTAGDAASTSTLELPPAAPAPAPEPAELAAPASVSTAGDAASTSTPEQPPAVPAPAPEPAELTAPEAPSVGAAAT